MSNVFCKTRGCIELSHPDDGLYCEMHILQNAARIPPSSTSAAHILSTAAKHMEDRAATYDQQGGERSIGKTVEMFNILTGAGLTDEQGWLFMTCLKMVRAQQGRYRADSYEDGAAYFALAGESAAQERV
jgi:hypothetical protein